MGALFESWCIMTVFIFMLMTPISHVRGWGKEGHYVVCKIAEPAEILGKGQKINYLSEEALAAVIALLPDHAEGDLAAVCSWADEIRFHYRWSSPLHYVDTPDFRCNYQYCRDCHDSYGRKDRCATGAIYNYTMQLMPQRDDTNLSVAKHNLTEALMFLSHFVGDVHQPLHVGFTGDEGGNTIIVRWFRRKTNLHHVWDTMIIESALKTFYNKDLATMILSIQNNITDSFVDVYSNENCNGTVCPDQYASESISLACRFAYRNATAGSTLQAWSMEGHAMTCKIAQGMLKPEVAHAVQMLLPDYVNGDLSAICVWPDQVRHWYKYRWTSPLHFIDTPDQACSFKYQRDCHDPHGAKDMCVAGAITNFTNQLSHYRHGTADRRYNMTEALLFLAHFMGDIHQPMHVGFTSDEGGNTIGLRWFGHKSNLHHVWDREIILTAAADYYDKDINLLQEGIEGNITDGIWSGDLVSWRDCSDIFSCVNKYAVESIDIACKWGYKNVKSGDTLSEDYFNSRLPIVMKRIAQGGVRLAMILNRVFGDSHESSIAAT
ncbi:hypothetical protein OROHE_001481 [Orobanche hederae]